MEHILKKHEAQMLLNAELRQYITYVGLDGIEYIESLLQKGADPNYRPEFEDSLICVIMYNWPPEIQVEAIELLISFGANVNFGSGEGLTPLQEAIEGKHAIEVQNLLLSNGAVPIQFSKEAFDASEINCRFGRSNPEKVSDAYHDYMIATGKGAYDMGTNKLQELLKSEKIKDYEKDFEELTAQVRAGKISAEAGAGFFNYLINGKPKWCTSRFGSSYHFLKDGTFLQIGGEYEDSYDPEFNIYNDVISIGPDGTVDLFFYPEQSFPPTDFHSSTKLEDQIIIIGGLGYQKDRVTGKTNMFALNLGNFTISPIRFSGDPPGWIYKHTTLLDEQNKCLYVMEGQKWIDGKIVENKSVYRFDLKKKHWSFIS